MLIDECSNVTAHVALRRAEVLNVVNLVVDERSQIHLIEVSGVLQLMAYYRSVAKGLNPDRPSNLTAVVKLDF